MSSESRASALVDANLRRVRQVPPIVSRARREPARTFRSAWWRITGGRSSSYRQGEFHTFYERGFVSAESPAQLLFRHNREVAHIEDVLRGVHVRRSLEIGCGFGRLSPVFAGHADTAIATDINRRALAEAQRSYPEAERIQASVTDLAFPDGSFDLVTTWTVLQHVPPMLIDSAMAEIRRVTHNGSVVLLCEEGRLLDAEGEHCWHRPPEFYRERLSGMTLVRHGPIAEIERCGGTSPGTVMFFRHP